MNWLSFILGGLAVGLVVAGYFVWGWNNGERQARATERAAQRRSQGGRPWIRE